LYLNLSRMALDYLSIPATSTAVEWVFSQGRHLLHFMCNCLSSNSIWAYMCLGSWCWQELVLMEDVVGAVKDNMKKRKREATE
jgi:hypothetical protein